MYDLMVIGWGKGGKTLAGMCAKKGMKVAVIERDAKMYGGTCPNVGCLPSKAMVHRSKVLDEMGALGVERDFEFNKIIYKNALTEKMKMVEKVNKANYNALANLDNITIYNGDAKFLSNEEVEVNGEILKAKKIVINTGSTPVIPNIKGVDLEGVGTSTEFLNLEELPEKLLVVGSGYIGLEFASYFSSFGSQVKVFEGGNKFLHMEDEDVSESILDLLTRQGLEIKLEVKVKEFVKSENNKIIVKYELNGTLYEEEFDKVLLATGRKANTRNLGLENTDIKLTERGEIVINEYLETTVKNVYAVGDVKGGEMFTAVSLDDSRIVFPQIINEEPKRSLNDERLVPKVLFIDPSYARVGMTEKEAKEKNIKYTLKKTATTIIPKSIVIGETEGFAKILINENDEIIGAFLMNYEAAEMINILALAISQKIKSSVLRDFIYTHPVFTEGLNEILK